MNFALAYKEFRETLPVAAIGLAAFFLVAAGGTSFGLAPQLFNDRQDSIPFVSDNFPSRLAIVAGVFAIALGFWQMLGDFYRDAQLFLLHRPISRETIYGVKLTIGLAVYLSCTALAILVHALWAATPGTHASPFEWSMTLSAWRSWLTITSLYLAASLCGIYPAAWFGTRLAPLVAMIAISSILAFLDLPTGVDLLLIAVINVALVIAIFQVVRTREFA